MLRMTINKSPLFFRNIILFIFAFTAPLFPQNLEQISVVKLTNFEYSGRDTILFDLILTRTSDRWNRWANGTFQFKFADPSIQTTMDSLGIEYVDGSSDLPIIPLAGIIPRISYIITPRIFSDRVSVTVAGPELYDDCKYISFNDSIVIGKFKLYSKFGKFCPIDLMFLEPYIYYQACAFKLQQDSLVNNMPFYMANDNVEMDDNLSTTVAYFVDQSHPEMILENFNAIYRGAKKVALEWKTRSEYLNSGFILKRAYVPHGDRVFNFNYLVSRFDGSRPVDTNLIGMITSKTGKIYRYELDTVDYRGDDYCYELSYRTVDGTIRPLDTSCVRIPNAVITKAYVDENPFTESTTIYFILDDDALVTADVYNLEGKHIINLLNSVYKNRTADSKEPHKLFFTAPAGLSTGFYEIIIFAYPVKDPSIEYSHAVVKIQLAR